MEWVRSATNLKCESKYQLCAGWSVLMLVHLFHHTLHYSGLPPLLKKFLPFIQAIKCNCLSIPKWHPKYHSMLPSFKLVELSQLLTIFFKWSATTNCPLTVGIYFLISSDFLNICIDCLRRNSENKGHFWCCSTKLGKKNNRFVESKSFYF